MNKKIDGILDRIKKRLRLAFPQLWVFIKGNKFLFSKKSYLCKSGYIESMKRSYPCRSDGSPLPWMNYAVIHFLEDRISTNSRVFEYGTGSSTLFWSALTRHLVAVEHNPDWYRQIKENIPQNVELIYCPLDDKNSYSDAIKRFPGNLYEIIVVDGLERSACLKIAPEKLSPNGVIIFDDSDRECWQDGVQFLINAGFRQLKFVGLKPTGFGVDQTTIFYRDDNCFGI